MGHHGIDQPDYGMGEKKLGIYLFGIVCCVILTVISFWAVMIGQFSKGEILAIIFAAACIQFLVQVVCFLRLNSETESGRMNVGSILFTFVVLFIIIFCSLWIMWSLNYYMMH